MGTVRKYLSLFPGLGFGAGYKILQRVYKFGGQVSGQPQRDPLKA